MKVKEKRIRILDLQDQYCQECDYQKKALIECAQHCEAGRELSSLAKEICEKKYPANTPEKWDTICQEAATLYNQGIGITSIAKKMGCHTTTLRDQMKKRGVWAGITQSEIQERSRKKWDDCCQRAEGLRKKGWSWPKIATYLEVPAASLRNQMSKRGLYSS
ncbi:hypothetical protein [Bacillus cereus group sp. BfR-BA-01349]|uniref:hypothetical protein n=1 Tax=Bacillus cereus group sp. BfR-BA-01349 TaxID=2920312 RepID=UPI001F5AB9C1